MVTIQKFVLFGVIAMAFGCGSSEPSPPKGTPPVEEACGPEAQPALHDSMKPLEFLVGKWQGEGWIQMGPGEPESFHQTETVSSKLDGRVLVIEGVGTSGGADGGSEAIIHEALGVISWNMTDSHYRFSTYLRDGRSLDAAPNVLDGRMEWGFMDGQGGTIRYTIQRTESGQWFEVGERSVDSVSWLKFFEMTLDRVDE